MGSSRSSSRSSSSSSDSDRSYKKVKNSHKHKSKSGHDQPPPYPTAMHIPEGQHILRNPPSFPVPGGSDGGLRAVENNGAPSIPPQGRRFQTDTTAAFPTPDIVGNAPFRDLGGEPIYVGSAVFHQGNSVHPCKLAPSLSPVCRVAYGGVEYEHNGRYDLLPITGDMEWVPTSHGLIPSGRRPVDGGFEEDGKRLYHAVAVVQGCSVPGKTGEHLRAANVAFGGAEVQVAEGYWILCWRH